MVLSTLPYPSGRSIGSAVGSSIATSGALAFGSRSLGILAGGGDGGGRRRRGCAAAWRCRLPWPPPDDRDGDLNDHPGPAWLDRVATAVRSRLAGLRLVPVVGHADRESQNLRWDSGRPLAVRAFNAKRERMAGGGPHLDRLARELPERAGRAGLRV
jgi:hypothetical protein